MIPVLSSMFPGMHQIRPLNIGACLRSTLFSDHPRPPGDWSTVVKTLGQSDLRLREYSRDLSARKAGALLPFSFGLFCSDPATSSGASPTPLLEDELSESQNRSLPKRDHLTNKELNIIDRHE
jgi:hypothetical protein